MSVIGTIRLLRLLRSPLSVNDPAALPWLPWTLILLCSPLPVSDPETLLPWTLTFEPYPSDELLAEDGLMPCCLRLCSPGLVGGGIGRIAHLSCGIGVIGLAECRNGLEVDVPEDSAATPPAVAECP